MGLGYLIVFSVIWNKKSLLYGSVQQVFLPVCTSDSINVMSSYTALLGVGPEYSDVAYIIGPVNGNHHSRTRESAFWIIRPVSFSLSRLQAPQ